jgi:hypothetical protein
MVMETNMLKIQEVLRAVTMQKFVVVNTNAFWKSRGSPTQTMRPEKRATKIIDQDDLNGLIIMTTKIIVVMITTGATMIIHVTVMTLNNMNTQMVTITQNWTQNGTIKMIQECHQARPWQVQQTEGPSPHSSYWLELE